MWRGGVRTEGWPEIWHFRVSHYNEKVRWALDHKGIPHVRHTLLPGFHIPVARWLSGQNQLPIVRYDGHILNDSSKILKEIETKHPSPPLFPEAPEELQQAVQIQNYFDQEVAPALRRVFWATYINDASNCAKMATDGAGPILSWLWRVSFPAALPLYRNNMGLHPHQVSVARSNIETYFGELESLIKPSGYLVGDAFSVADLTAAAVMTAIVRPAEFPYQLPEPWPEELTEIREEISRYPACEWVLDIYNKHRGESHEADAQQVAAADV
jgi:glutathione S-transferase